MPPSHSASPAVTILSLPNDVLVRIFSFFEAAPPLDENFFAQRQSTNPGSPSLALAHTCGRLAALRRARVVRFVDLSGGEDVSEAPGSLIRHPFADAAVLNTEHAEAAEELFRNGGGGTLGRLRGLGVTAVPSNGFADTFALAVPLLRELVVGSCVDNSCRHPGMIQLLRRLPARLRRFKMQCPWLTLDCLVQRALWEALGGLEELEELHIESPCRVTRASIDGLKKSRRLRRFSMLHTSDVTLLQPVAAALVASLPTGLRYLSMETWQAYDHLDASAGGCFTHLAELECFDVERLVSNLAELQPFAPRLRRLSLSHGNIYVDGELPMMPCLEELSLTNNSGVDDDLLRRLLRSLDLLKRLYIVMVQSSDRGMAAAFSAAACADKLLSLAIEPNKEGIGIRPGETFRDATVTAIGRTFSHLNELRLPYLSVTASGMESLGQGCAHLTKLFLRNCGNLNYLTPVMGKRFTQLEELDISSTNIEATGLEFFGGGCPSLVKLSLRGCKRVDNTTAEVIGLLLRRLTRLDVSKTNVTPRGVELLGRGCPDLIQLSLKFESKRDYKTAAAICKRLWQRDVASPSKLKICVAEESRPPSSVCID